MSKAAREAGRAERRAAEEAAASAPVIGSLTLDDAIWCLGLSVGATTLGTPDHPRPALVFIFAPDPEMPTSPPVMPPIVIDAMPEVVAAVAQGQVEAIRKAQAVALEAATDQVAERGNCSGCGTPIFGPLLETGRCLKCQNADPDED